MPLADGDWRVALVIWSLPILVIAVVSCFVRPATREQPEVNDAEKPPEPGSAFPRWNDRQVWQFGLLLACSIVIFFAINAYAGAVLRSRGEEQALAGLLAAFNATPFLASVVVLAAPQWIGRRNPLGASALFAALGLAGFVFLDGWASWAAAVVAGLASTIELILLVSLPATIAKGLGVTRLSAGTTLIGYAIAFILPLIGGWIAEETGRTETALLPALVFAIMTIPALGGTRRYVCASLVTKPSPK